MTNYARTRAPFRIATTAGLAIALATAAAGAQQPTQSDQKVWTAQDDHKNMMEQLGIKALRPGPSGNEQRAESRELRRGDGESVSESARRSHAEERQEGHDRRHVVGAAPRRDRRGLRARGARPRAEERAEGDVDGRPRPTIGHVGGTPVVGKQLDRPRRQLVVSRRSTSTSR